MAYDDYDPRVHKLIRHTFESVGSAVEYARKSADKRASSHTASADWTETESFDAACKMALHGWQGARVEIDLLTSAIKTEVMEQTYTDYAPMWDTSGGVVDVQAFVNGEPECMIDFMPEPRVADRPVVKVLVNTCFSGGFSTQKILKRGAAICGLVEVLMSLNFSVEVWAETSDGPCGKGNGYFWSALVKVKGVDDYVDIDSFAFVLAHPSWLRRVVFGMMEGENEVVRKRFGFGSPYGNGYGKVGNLTAKDELGATVCVEGALLGRDGRHIYEASDWIKDTLEGLGVKVGSHTA